MLSDYLGLTEVARTFEVARQVLGTDFSEIAQTGPAELMNRTTLTQPLLLTACVAMYRQWAALGGRRPDAFAGHSLGEYAALVAAGALDFDDALDLIAYRAKVMDEATSKVKGSMAAVLGLAPEAVVSALTDLQGQAEAVNFNSEAQTVIAGSLEGLEKASSLLKSAGAKRVVPLAVSGPFHSSFMLSAQEKLASRIAAARISAPKVPVIQNVTGQAVTDVSLLRENLIEQVASPVQWVKTMETLSTMGVTDIAECGPGKVLTGLAKRSMKDVRLHSFAEYALMQKALEELR